MSFDEWLNDLRNILEFETGIPRDQHQAVFNIKDDAWLKMYKDGLSPEDAYREEKSALEQLS